MGKATALELITYRMHDAQDGRLRYRANERPDADYVQRMKYAEPVQDNHVYRVGDEVFVSAYSRLRPGRVTKLGRTKVTVEFTSDAAGQNVRTRAFSGAEVIPAAERETWRGHFSR
jgi:FKBP-type peptidyl-prolyl cis-trans isomerase 2